MALLRVIALKDASATALSSGANGTAYDLSSLFTSGGAQKLYAGLHVTQMCSTAAGPDSLAVFVQSASSSGFATATTEIIFTAMTSKGAQWATTGLMAQLTISSTDRKFFRTRWTLSTGSNAPSVKFMDWVSIR
jgi:hypothetical protein